MAWHYYNDSGEKIGPITSDELKQLARQGTVTRETRVEAPNGSVGPAKNVKGKDGVGLPFLYQSPFNDIFEAAEKGTVEDVRYFIEQKGVDVNVQNAKGSVPLHFAVDNPDINVIKYLVSKGANVNVKNNDNNTALYYAAKDNSNVEFLQYLISQGADVNAICFKGNTPLYIAAKDSSNVDILECLISHGATVNVECFAGNMPIHIAAQCNTNVDILRCLISHGADVNSNSQVDGYTPLHLAAARNANEEVAKCLISHGANIKARENIGRTPLHVAVAFNPNVKVAKYLISQKADVNARENSGSTPLHTAVAFNTNVEAAEYLISHGADVNARENIGGTPLHIAVALNPNVEIAKCLIRHGADVNAKDNEGFTPLDAADTEEKKRILREAMPISKQTVNEILEQLSPDLNNIDAGLRSIEDAIFGNGPFTAKNMENTMSDLAASLRYRAASDSLHSRFEHILPSRTVRSSPRFSSVSEKKDDYQEVFDEFSETITKVKKLKELQVKLGPNNRLASLIERCEKCEKEISKLRDVVRNFSEY